ncbi:MAG: Ku protein [bacterium]
MGARAIWSGKIRFEKLELPVKLYSAVEDRGVHFRLLHDKDRQPVHQTMVNSKTGQEVPKERVRKGVEVEPGAFVLIGETDAERLEPEASREIEIERFVDPDEIGHQWYDRPYYLGPAEGDDQAYWNFVEALQRSGKEGVARWVMRKKPYVGALRIENGHLMLITLHFDQEVILAEDLEPPPGRELDKKELAMAGELVKAMADRFEPEKFRDEFRNRVMELVEAKAKGRKLKLVKPEKKAGRSSLAGALQASIAAARKAKHA